MQTSCLDPPVASGRKTPTILCIDDDPEVSGAIDRRLGIFDVHLIRAFHGMHGYSEALRHKPDVIIMDLSMPNGDGATILECLRRNRQTAGIPVIVLTGIRDRHHRQRVLNLGADRFLHKPIHIDELTHELRQFVELREHDDPTA